MYMHETIHDLFPATNALYSDTVAKIGKLLEDYISMHVNSNY